MADWFNPLPISTPKQSFKWGADLSIAPSENIVKPTRRRQVNACDWCRYSKKRCDGRTPCERCKMAQHECVYTPHSKRRKASSASTSPDSLSSPSSVEDAFLQLSPIRTSPTLHLQAPPLSSTQFMAKNYLDLFFSRMYMVNRLLPNFAMSQFDQPTDRPILLQLYAAAANASRAYGGNIGSSLYLNFEERAQHLARELFDDISPQTAYGFHLLSYHTRGRDIPKSNHYRDMANSICDRLLRSKKLSHNERDHTLRIKLINFALRDLTDPGPDLEMEVQEPLSDMSIQLLKMNKVMASCRLLFSKIVHEDESHELVMRILSPAQCQEGCQAIQSTMDWYEEAGLVPPQFGDVFQAFTSMFQSIILFAAGQDQEALRVMHGAMDVMERSLNIMAASDTGIMDCFHYCFLVAYAAGDVPLMQKIQAIQEPFITILPCTRHLVEQDSQRLAEFIESQKASPSSSSSVTLPLAADACPLPAPPCVQPLFPTSATAPSPCGTENSPIQPLPSPSPFIPSPGDSFELQYGGLFSTSDAIPFSLDEFIESLESKPFDLNA